MNSKHSLLSSSNNNKTYLVVITISDENYCYTKKKVESPSQFDGAAIIVLCDINIQLRRSSRSNNEFLNVPILRC